MSCKGQEVETGGGGAACELLRDNKSADQQTVVRQEASSPDVPPSNTCWRADVLKVDALGGVGGWG